MATKIRLKRIGRRNRPFYRMVVMDSRNRRDGAAIEELGWYNPIDPEHSFDINGNRVIHWLGEGAEVTDAAHKLLRRCGIAHKWHLMQQGLDESQIEKEMKKWELNHEDVKKARSEREEKKAEEKAKKKVETSKKDDDENKDDIKAENLDTSSDSGDKEIASDKSIVDDSEENKSDDKSSSEEE